MLRANSAIISSMNDNLSSAVVSVLPLLPLHFSEKELFLVGVDISFVIQRRLPD